MTKQLTLINGSTKSRAGHAWQLDAHTRQLGRTGVAKARADDLQRLLRAHRIRADDQLWTNAVLLRPPPYPFGRLAAPGREWSLAVAKRRVVPGRLRVTKQVEALHPITIRAALVP